MCEWIEWIDSVFSLAYQTANDANIKIANTMVLVVSDTLKCSTMLSVINVPTTLMSTTAIQYTAGMYSGTRNCTMSATMSNDPITNVVVFRLSPSLPLMKSAKVSPTVVHNTLITQKYIVTSGTLLSFARSSGEGCSIDECSLIASFGIGSCRL